MKSRITLRIGKILEALTAPVGHRVQRLSEGERAGRWKEAGRQGGWVGGGPAHRVQGFMRAALESRCLSSVRKGRKEGPCPAQSPLKALHDL